MKRDPVREALKALAEAARRPHDAGTLPLVKASLTHLGLAPTRCDAAFSLLVELVAPGTAADSRAAVQALGLFPHDEELQRRVGAALAGRPPPTRRSRPTRSPLNVSARRMP